MPDTSPTSVLPRDLGQGLVLQAAETDQDMQGIAELYGVAFEPEVATIVPGLERYPGMRRSDFVLVRDQSTGKVVSSICLVPTTWRYEGVLLRVAELGVVATHPDYRKRGLVRQQMRWFESRLQAEGYHLASIQGIYHFYRQFGFEYIIPMGRGCEMHPDQVPDAAEDEVQATVRPATAEDMPILLRFLEETGKRLSISLVREAGAWLLQDDVQRTDDEAIVTCLVLEDGVPTGYFRYRRQVRPENDHTVILEASSLSYPGAMAALRFGRDLARARAHKRICISLYPSAPLSRLAVSLGARVVPPYAWYVRVPDAVRLLQAIAPVLEARLSGSFLAGYTGKLCLDLYSSALVLEFQQGRLESVRSGEASGPRARFPWWAAWQLWLGHRSRAELMTIYPDAWVDAPVQPLVDALFPARESWVFPKL